MVSIRSSRTKSNGSRQKQRLLRRSAHVKTLYIVIILCVLGLIQQMNVIHRQSDHYLPVKSWRTNLEIPSVKEGWEPKEQSIALWAGNGTTDGSHLHHSKLECIDATDAITTKFSKYKTCHCYNCCMNVKEKMVYVFDGHDSTPESFSNVTGRTFGNAWVLGVQHKSGTAASSFVGSPWVEHSVHYTGIKFFHPLTLWFSNMDIWYTWHARNWFSSKRFHWMLLSSKTEDSSLNRWYAMNHPDLEMPLFLSSVEEPRVCFRHMMIGHHHVSLAVLDDTFSTKHSFLLGRNVKPKFHKMNKQVIPLYLEYTKFLLKRSGLDQIEPIPNKAIYISRNDSNKGRNILNEAEVLKVVKEEGYQVEEVLYGKLTKDQAHNITRSAALVFGSHGAGFANIMVCDPHRTSVIELHPWGFQKWGYGFIAEMLGIDYRYWIAPDEAHTRHSEESLRAKETGIKRDYYRHRDFWVDVEEFRDIVKRVKAARGAHEG